jgi:DNA topoisomerase-3
VRSETKRANISHAETVKQKKAKETAKKNAGITLENCPKCKQGQLIKGKAAYGCSQYKKGCDFVMPFSFKGKRISEKQFIRLLQKGSTVNLKGFKTDSGPNPGNSRDVEGLVRFDENFNLKLEEKPVRLDTKTSSVQKPDRFKTEQHPCPKCKKGTIIKGKTAYGCSDYKLGCDFKMTFEAVKTKLVGKTPTKTLIYKILKGDARTTT